jgi:hypothetical protein
MTRTKKVIHWFYTLSSRERVLVGGVVIFGAVVILWNGVQFLSESIVDNGRYISQRRSDYMNLLSDLRRYRQLDDRVKSLEATFEKSEMTLEQVTTEIDRIVRESIGSDNYELQKSSSTEEVGATLQQQGFTLSLRSITLDQLVQLLFKLESGKSPLLLGKVELERRGATPEMRALIEVSSISKSTPKGEG